MTDFFKNYKNLLTRNDTEIKAHTAGNDDPFFVATFQYFFGGGGIYSVSIVIGRDWMLQFFMVL